MKIKRTRPMVQQFEPRTVMTYPNGVWTSKQFWDQANKTAKDSLEAMVAQGHSLPSAAKNGLIDPNYAADYLVESVVQMINAECIPAGNA